MNSSIRLDFGMNKIDPIEINLWKLEIDLSNLAKVIYLRGIDNKFVKRYCVNQQCCPGGICPGTSRRPSVGGLRIFWLNHWQIQTKCQKKILFFFLKILPGFASDLAKKSGDSLQGVPGRFPPGQHCWFTRS